MMLASIVLRTMAAAVRQLDLPAPVHYAIGTSSIHLGFRDRSGVDRWARHVGLPPASEHGNGEYASVEFFSDTNPGWCGASVIVLCVPNNPRTTQRLAPATEPPAGSCAGGCPT